jgi:hypothetical protein
MPGRRETGGSEGVGAVQARLVWIPSGGQKGTGESQKVTSLVVERGREESQGWYSLEGCHVG